MAGELVIYPAGGAAILDCYFNNATPPEMELALVAYSSQSNRIDSATAKAAGSVPLLSEISAPGYDRLRVYSPRSLPSGVTSGDGLSYHSLCMHSTTETDIYGNPVELPIEICITGKLQPVMGSSAIIGWALLVPGSLSRPFTSTQATTLDILFAQEFQTPIPTRHGKTYITIEPFNLSCGGVTTTTSAEPNLRFPTWTGGVLYDMAAAFFRGGRGWVDTPSQPAREVVLLKNLSPGPPVADFQEITGYAGYSRQPLGAGTVTKAATGLDIATITFADAVFNIGNVNASTPGSEIVGYMINKASGDPLNPTPTTILTDVTCYTSYVEPIPPTKKLKIDITLSVSLSFVHYR